MGVTNIWHLLNLTESPFFQDPLSPDARAQYPIELFVGREQDAEYVLRGIGGSPHTRHAIQGAPGVGKTTFVQYIKASAAEDGYLADAEAIPLSSATSADDLRLRILLSAYLALVAHDPALADHPTMQDVRQLIGVERLRGGNFSVGGKGFGLTLDRHAQRLTGPAALTVQPEAILRALSLLILQIEGVQGILIHLNNLENVVDAVKENAGRVLRDLRDTGLMYPGLHYLIAGTDDAIRTAISKNEQIRSVISNPGSLRPLTVEELDRLLQRRYEFLRHFDDRPIACPVTPVGLDLLHQTFGGNLRGLLQALDEAAKALIGRRDDPTAPMDVGDLRPALTLIYQRRLENDLDATQRERLAALARMPRGRAIVAGEAKKAFRLSSRSAAMDALQELVAQGYLEDAGTDVGGEARRGRPSRAFRLTGMARIALGEFAG